MLKEEKISKQISCMFINFFKGAHDVSTSPNFAEGHAQTIRTNSASAQKKRIAPDDRKTRHIHATKIFDVCRRHRYGTLEKRENECF